MYLIAHALAVAIKTSAHCVMLFREIWKTKTLYVHERVYVIFLNSQNIPFCYQRLNIGNYSNTLFDVRTMVDLAMETRCKSVIIAHNHTHGTPHPSDYDIAITEEIKNLLNAMSINLADHIILSPEGDFSFRDEGLLKAKRLHKPNKVFAEFT